MHALIFAAALAAAMPAVAMANPDTTVVAPQSQFERERQAILAMAGDFRVRFDMRENVAFVDGYEPLEPDTSGGNEIVRVVYDTGDKISLQHILVMKHGDQTFVIKHWRQDWVYQPETVLTYAGPDEWILIPVSADKRAGAWSQTVWQTDDSPRYGGVGHWSFDNGLTEWVSDDTWRPLARRDAVRSPVYDRYEGVNRHALTPKGWVHIQDNMKMGPSQGDAGDLVAYVQEDVVNTYRRWDGYDAKPGDDYWNATKVYWAAVRDAWDQAIAASNGVHVEEEPHNGAVTGPMLMGLADQIVEGEISEAEAIEQARATIAEATAR